MNAVGEYLLVKADPWTSTRIVFPVQETLQPQLQRHTRQREHCSGDALRQKLLVLVTQALFFYKQAGAAEIFIVGTCVDDRLVLVCTSGAAGVPEQVHELAGKDDDSMACMYLRRAVEVAISSMEQFTIPVFSCFTTETLAGVACWTMPAASGPGTLVQTLATLAVYARPSTAYPQVHLPLLDSSGCVFAFESVQLSPLFAQLYVKLFDHALVNDGMNTLCTADAVADVQRVLNGLTQSHNSWTTQFLEFPPDFSMASFTTIPPALPALPVAPMHDGETVHLHGDLSTLSQVLTPALISYASTSTLDEWRQQYDTSPLVLADMRQQRQRLVVRAYIEVKDEELKEAGMTAAALAEHKLAMLHALAHERLTWAQMDGLVFDLLLLDVQLANVPAMYHPGQFLSDTRGEAFTTVMLLMYWRQTLARFIAVGVETLESDTLTARMEQYRHFRVGLIVQSAQVATVKSAFRMVQGLPCFFINVSESAMRCRPTLQQQKAENRNFFVGYFITQALVQLVPLLCQTGEDACVVCASLFGSYHGQMKPNSLNNLTKLYEKLQGTARSIRHKISRGAEPATTRRR